MNKLKMFLFVLLVFSIFSPKVSAATIWNWTDGEQLKQSSELYIARCTSQKSCSDITTNSFDYSSETGWFYESGSTTDIRSEYQFYSTNDISFSANDYGVLVYFRPDQALQQNYMYSLTYYLCSNGGATLNSINAFTGKNMEQMVWEDYPVITLINGTYSAENRPFNNSREPIFNTCTKYMYTFTSTSTRNYIGIKLNSTVATTQDISFLGYNLVNLGFTDYAKQDALLSIQESVNSTNSELNGVKDSIGETNDKLDGVNDSIGETNSKLDDVNNSLTNSDTTGSQGTANGFFNNFNTEDNGGLSAIVTAPLRAINSMVDGTCQPLTATWRGKTISLPCGTEFWDKMSPIRTFLNVIEGGIICYGILIDIYKMINRMKNPEDDRVDVMKL